MEKRQGIMGFLEGKNILVTGATGFLGKLFVEKVLRVQPNVGRLYLLLRAPDAGAATERLWNEVLGKDVFRVLKEQHGELGFRSFVAAKIVAVAGDVSEEGLGIEPSSSGLTRDALQADLHVIVNSAATTRFDERYDIALRTNTFGAKHVSDFSKKCPKLEVLLHVSTAYVAVKENTGGRVLERPIRMGETLDGLPVLSIEEEAAVACRLLEQLDAANATKMDKTIAMRKLGMQRARAWGWPNTYVFTKAMGEMLVGQIMKTCRNVARLPVAIIRPAIISSTCREPFPGWIEGCRTFDCLIAAYAKGKLSSVYANSGSIMDTVPGDLVANAMITIMVHQLEDGRCDLQVYNVGSSTKNPMNFGMLEHAVYSYFLANPRTDNDGKRIQASRVTFHRSKLEFILRVKLPFYLLCKALCLVNFVTFFSIKNAYTSNSRTFKYLMRIAKLYEPYTFFKGSFDTQNTERAREAVLLGSHDGCSQAFDFDVSNIDWEDYLVNTHIPGLLRYEVK